MADGDGTGDGDGVGGDSGYGAGQGDPGQASTGPGNPGGSVSIGPTSVSANGGTVGVAGDPGIGPSQGGSGSYGGRGGPAGVAGTGMGDSAANSLSPASPALVQFQNNLMMHLLGISSAEAAELGISPDIMMQMFGTTNPVAMLQHQTFMTPTQHMQNALLAHAKGAPTGPAGAPNSNMLALASSIPGITGAPAAPPALQNQLANLFASPHSPATPVNALNSDPISSILFSRLGPTDANTSLAPNSFTRAGPAESAVAMNTPIQAAMAAHFGLAPSATFGSTANMGSLQAATPAASAPPAPPSFHQSFENAVAAAGTPQGFTGPGGTAGGSSRWL